MKKTSILWYAVFVLSIALISSAGAQDAPQKFTLGSSVDVQFYGFIKLDAAYDTERTSPGNFYKWVESDLYRQNDDQFNMTANQTRLGFNFTGPTVGAAHTTGKVEVDFYGSSLAENKAGILLRHAFLKIAYPENDFSILAGQTSDVISPLVPSTINYTVGWWTGNPGYRRPQVRVTKGFDLDSDVKMEFIGAVTRNIGSSSVFGPGDSGEDSGLPTFQSRLGFTFPLFGGYTTAVGISGHWGEEEYDFDALDNYDKCDSWSFNVDLVQPVCDWLTFKGEFFTGENLSQYLAGIGQGVTVDGVNETVDGIGSQGGWITANLTPIEDWVFTFGAMMDDVDASDVGIGDRTLNNAIFANALYSINAKTQVGIEVTKLHTERRQEGGADSIRTQLAFIYKF